MPVINHEKLLVDLIKARARLTWWYNALEPDITQVYIEQCDAAVKCILHDVTNSSDMILDVATSDGDTFYLIVYQDGLLSYRSSQFSLGM